MKNPRVRIWITRECTRAQPYVILSVAATAVICQTKPAAVEGLPKYATKGLWMLHGLSHQLNYLYHSIYSSYCLLSHLLGHGYCICFAFTIPSVSLSLCWFLPILYIHSLFASKYWLDYICMNMSPFLFVFLYTSLMNPLAMQIMSLLSPQSQMGASRENVFRSLGSADGWMVDGW
jgi:hypothetical protein